MTLINRRQDLYRFFEERSGEEPNGWHVGKTFYVLDIIIKIGP